MKDNSGFVYLFQAGETNRFKIGCSKNPDVRIKDIERSGSPYPIKCIGSRKFKDMFKAEKQLHRVCDSSREFGEWFDLTASQLSTVCRRLNITPRTHPRDRTTDEMVIGNTYYISWDGNKVTEVELLSLEYDSALVKPIKGREQWWLQLDEVRSSPIEAIFNHVTN